MKRTRFVVVSMALAVALVNLGCASRPSEGPQPAIRVARENVQLRYNSVVFLDRGLPSRIEVQRSDARRSPTNTVQVLVLFRNRTDYPQQVECRTQFYDSEGVPLNEPSAWKRVFLEPNAIQQWTHDSLSHKADLYYVEVREGR